MRQLRHEDQDRQRVDEPGDDRSRHELHQEVEPDQAGHDLDQAHEDGGGEEVFDPVFADQRDHQHHDRGGRRRDHARTPAGERYDDGDGDRRIETDTRIDPGDDREADGLGNERERDHDPGKDVATRVGQPVTAERGGKCHEVVQMRSAARAAALSRG
ncbi:hypothetical protein J2X37_001316 [Croceicoccus sp. BE223]|nr:hypothetical protein [Croceicoccus sp. BE223]